MLVHSGEDTGLILILIANYIMPHLSYITHPVYTLIFCDTNNELPVILSSVDMCLWSCVICLYDLLLCTCDLLLYVLVIVCDMFLCDLLSCVWCYVLVIAWCVNVILSDLLLCACDHVICCRVFMLRWEAARVLDLREDVLSERQQKRPHEEEAQRRGAGVRQQRHG